MQLAKSCISIISSQHTHVKTNAHITNLITRKEKEEIKSEFNNSVTRLASLVKVVETRSSSLTPRGYRSDVLAA